MYLWELGSVTDLGFIRFFCFCRFLICFRSGSVWISCFAVLTLDRQLCHIFPVWFQAEVEGFFFQFLFFLSTVIPCWVFWDYGVRYLGLLITLYVNLAKFVWRVILDCLLLAWISSSLDWIEVLLFSWPNWYYLFLHLVSLIILPLLLDACHDRLNCCLHI